MLLAHLGFWFHILGPVLTTIGSKFMLDHIFLLNAFGFALTLIGSKINSSEHLYADYAEIQHMIQAWEQQPLLPKKKIPREI